MFSKYSVPFHKNNDYWLHFISGNSNSLFCSCSNTCPPWWAQTNGPASFFLHGPSSLGSPPLGPRPAAGSAGLLYMTAFAVASLVDTHYASSLTKFSILRATVYSFALTRLLLLYETVAITFGFQISCSIYFQVLRSEFKYLQASMRLTLHCRVNVRVKGFTHRQVFKV